MREENMNGHSPGPWEATRNTDCECLHLLGANGALIIDLPLGIVRGEDARLIAAAPELLEACKELAEVPGIVDAMPVNVWDAIESAIAKAEGHD
jgi:hypothetical protein